MRLPGLRSDNLVDRHHDRSQQQQQQQQQSQNSNQNRNHSQQHNNNNNNNHHHRSAKSTGSVSAWFSNLHPHAGASAAAAAAAAASTTATATVRPATSPSSRQRKAQLQFAGFNPDSRILLSSSPAFPHYPQPTTHATSHSHAAKLPCRNPRARCDPGPFSLTSCLTDSPPPLPPLPSPQYQRQPQQHQPHQHQHPHQQPHQQPHPHPHPHQQQQQQQQNSPRHSIDWAIASFRPSVSNAHSPATLLPALTRSSSVRHSRTRAQPQAAGDRRSVATDLVSAHAHHYSPHSSVDSPTLPTGLSRSRTEAGHSRTGDGSAHDSDGYSAVVTAAGAHSLVTPARASQPYGASNPRQSWLYDSADLSSLPAWNSQPQAIGVREEEASRHRYRYYDYDDDDDDDDDNGTEDIASDSAQYVSDRGLSMHAHAPNPADKTSSDSGQHQAALDRWSQRRLQRLNTEQGFREQRQGGHVPNTPSPNPSAINAPVSVPEQPPPSTPFHAPSLSQPYAGNVSDPAQHVASLPPSRAGHTSQNQHVGLAIQTPPPPPPALAPVPPTSSASSRQQHHGGPLESHPVQPQHPPPQQQQQQQLQQQQQQQQQQYSPSENGTDPNRPPILQSRSFSQHSDGQSITSNSTHTASKPSRSGTGHGHERLSVHNITMSRDGSHVTSGDTGAAFNIATPNNQQLLDDAGQSQPGVIDIARTTPQPQNGAGDEGSEESVAQLQKALRDLREKYNKVKKYYFEKEDQVKQLQNSLAHQRLSQSRTSLDDSEYTTRFSRLDGLIAQLAFSIRKSWRSVPSWLVNSINRDAVATGKQEMTAAGRAVISCWIVDEVFDRYFHPDLDPALSVQLKSVQKNIRRFAPLSQTAEEEDNLTAKVVNWRLATLEGLQDALRAPSCPENRQKLIDTLKDGLVAALATHLHDPPPSDLEGGVHMIVELVVSIAIHLPLESRDVVIEYFVPGYSILPDQMKIESGIPSLASSTAEDASERASMKSVTSDAADAADNGSGDPPSKKRHMLSALTGGGAGSGGSKKGTSGKHTAAAGGSSSTSSLGARPESAHKEEQPPRVRMAAGIGVSVRGRAVLVKAPVFST